MVGLKFGSSRINAMAAFAAILPSAWEPEENLCPDAPTTSPAMKRPLTVDILLYPQNHSLGVPGMSPGPLHQKPAQPACEPRRYGSVGIISEGSLSGSTFLQAQSPAWPMAISRKSSQASASRCLILLAS